MGWTDYLIIAILMVVLCVIGIIRLIDLILVPLHMFHFYDSFKKCVNKFYLKTIIYYIQVQVLNFVDLLELAIIL
jgi:hypothetical protein